MMILQRGGKEESKMSNQVMAGLKYMYGNADSRDTCLSAESVILLLLDDCNGREA